jgi:hypothetical protein
MEPVHDAPPGTNTPAWLSMTRNAFRDILQTRKLDEYRKRCVNPVGLLD